MPGSSRRLRSLTGAHGDQPCRARLRWLPIAVASLAALLPVTGVGAAEEPAAGGDGSASEAETQAEAMPDDSASGVEVVRYAGSDPYELSLAVAQALVDAGDGSSEWVVLASGESWTDAATAGPLAASLGAPVVLVPPGGLQTAAARPDLVEFLRSSGIRQVAIVGSPEVLPNHEPSVLYGLGMLPRNIERVHSDDPIGTAVAVAERLGAPAELGELGRTVFIASDQSVADAVAVGPLAASGPFSLLLTAPDALDPRIAAYLTEHEVAHAVLVGGTAAIAPAVQEVIEAAGATVTRLAGRDRSDTSRFAADLFAQHSADGSACADGPIRLGLVPAQHPEQALTAGPLLALQCAPLYFVQPERLARELRNTLFLAQHSPEGAHVVAFADDQVLPVGLLRPVVPPVRIATWQLVDVSVSGQPEVVLVVFDERGDQISIPNTRMTLPSHETRTASSHSQFLSYWRNRLTWAPNGHRVAYSHTADHGLRILDLATSEEHLLRYDDAEVRLNHFAYDWSQDSTKLYFSAELPDESTVSEHWTSLVGRRQYSPELFLYSVPDRSLTRLTYDDVSDFVLQSSPDGRRFTYYTTIDPGGSGGPYSRLTDLHTYDVVSGDSYMVASGFGTLVGDYAVWSRDGARIAFGGRSREPEKYWWQSELFVADHDGADLEQMTPTNCPECFANRVEFLENGWAEHYVTFPVSWSPDDQRIAYYSDASLHVHDFSTERVHVLLPRDFSRFDIADSFRTEVLGWSTDSKTLYVQLSGADCQVVAFNVADGTAATPTHRPVDTSGDNSWCGFKAVISPDSSQFAVVHPQTGLRLFGIARGQWQEILSDWSTTDPAVKNELRGCSVEWTTGGILARCDYLRSPDEDE